MTALSRFKSRLRDNRGIPNGSGLEQPRTLPIIAPCTFCGLLFIVVVGYRPYCSDECSRKATEHGRKASMTAAICSCGATFLRGSGSAIHCSAECRVRAWGGKRPQNQTWRRRTRLALAARDGFDFPGWQLESDGRLTNLAGASEASRPSIDHFPVPWHDRHLIADVDALNNLRLTPLGANSSKNFKGPQ